MTFANKNKQGLTKRGTMKIKTALTGCMILFAFCSLAQSPYLSISVKLPARHGISGGDSSKSKFVSYRISMKICDLKNPSQSDNWFAHDTSSVDFLKLNQSDINCGRYSYMEGTDDYAGNPGTKFNMYEYGNQVFAWEKIIVLRISNYSSRAWHPEMYIVLPVKYKSFRTHIDLTGIEFLSDKVVFLHDYKAAYDDTKLSISHSFENEKGTDAERFYLKKILEKKPLENRP